MVLTIISPTFSRTIPIFINPLKEIENIIEDDKVIGEKRIELGHNLSQNNDNEIKTSTELFGPKFYLRKFQDDHKDNEAENKGLGDNNINNNNDNVLGHGLYDNVKM